MFRQITVKGFDQSQFQVVQVFYPSKDGVKVPMFIVHRKASKLYIVNINYTNKLILFYLLIFNLMIFYLIF